MSKIHIDIRIPYWPDKQLGMSYNHNMNSVNDWVCFLDHDVLILNPAWYDMCCDAINQLGHKAAFITAKCNGIAQGLQLCQEAPQGHDILCHMRYAKQLAQKYGSKPVLIEKKTGNQLSGFFFITHKEAWKKVGGFCHGFLGVDNDYHGRIEHHGYDAYVMPGLYMYHIYRTKAHWKMF